MLKTIALATVLALGAASGASANSDPWIGSGYDVLVNVPNVASNAFASTVRPQIRQGYAVEMRDERFHPDAGGSLW